MEKKNPFKKVPTKDLENLKNWYKTRNIKVPEEVKEEIENRIK